MQISNLIAIDSLLELTFQRPIQLYHRWAPHTYCLATVHNFTGRYANGQTDRRQKTDVTTYYKRGR